MVSTSTPPKRFPENEYVYIEDVESMEQYRPGGYHLVSIGDKLQDRYRVVHKLGHGGYSTTWLAREERSQKLVAIKVGTAKSNPYEVNVLSALATPAQDTTPRERYGRDTMPSILDRFDIKGRNGIHPCYVMAPGQASVSEALEASDSVMFELDVARALVAQLALAVAFIHSRGMVHGDIHLGNVLLKLAPEVDQLSDEQLYDKYGWPTMQPVVRFDGQELPPGIPTHGTVPVWLGKPSDEVRLPEAKILLIDFGEAFEPARKEKYVSHTPLCTRPPEAHFEPSKALSFPSDVWSLACAIWSILGQRPLFDPWLANIDDLTRWQVDAFGILPPEWWLLWEDRGKWFDDNGVPLENREGVFSLGDRFRFSTQEPRQKEGMGVFEQDEEEALLAMLQSMLTYKPGDRSTASEVLDSEWMRKWAMPAHEKIP
ncbi:hypothetical protein V501_05889 [Pseudogymnoascus sp. VKM F-4519 (FW-2642)]|nr:hypothetical protein V501_05889 [Pseudogymnoascus sp. VKM F-4519 (FW-2642)]